MGLSQRVADLTPAEYLKIERAALSRHEYFRGQMFAKAGGSSRHCRIKTNVLSYLNSRLKGQPCSTYDSDLRIKCPTGLYTSPDASVLCGELEFDDEHKDTVLNPTLLVEVLSKSTEAYDRGKKFDHYRTIPSLREYVNTSWSLKMNHWCSGSFAMTTIPGPCPQFRNPIRPRCFPRSGSICRSRKSTSGWISRPKMFRLDAGRKPEETFGHAFVRGQETFAQRTAFFSGLGL
jgi:Putative restriction endonuclease